MVEPIMATTDGHGAANDGIATPEARRVQWPCPCRSLRLEDHQTNLWAFSLDLDADEIDRLLHTLSPEEQLRARRFRFDLHRDRFIAGRGQLRLLLSHYTRQEPARIQFAYGANGKPELVSLPPDLPLQFNLAHSAELALLAVNRSVPVGVDVEELHPLEDAPALVARFFSPRENLAFQGLRESQKLTAFFNLWTRKEAWLKATGEGIGYSLDKVEVSFLPDEEAQLFSTPQDKPAADWQLTSLKPASAFVAALAIPDCQNAIEAFQFQPALQESQYFFIE